MIKTTLIKKYLKEIPKNYLIFDIKYTQKELDYLQNLIITKQSTFDHFGNIDLLNDNELNDFIIKISNEENINIFNNIIHKIANKITKAYNTKYCWITIRATLPSTSFDIPRWHIDGDFFTGSNNIQSKFVTVLKGPGTLFIKKSNKINNIYEKITNKKYNEYDKLSIKIYNKEIENKYQKILADKFKDIRCNQLKINQGLIFLVGSIRNKLYDGLLHSEPKIDESRLFISIITGTESEITNLQKRWSK
jgi:hypothetical protein